MIIRVLLLIVMVIIMPQIYSQDVIYMTSGEQRAVIVKKVGVNTIEYLRYDNPQGAIYEVSKVEVSKPPSITFAIGLCISLPERSPRNAKGIRARAAVSAVIRIGLSRSTDPRVMVSCSGTPCLFRFW